MTRMPFFNRVTQFSIRITLSAVVLVSAVVNQVNERYIMIISIPRNSYHVTCCPFQQGLSSTVVQKPLVVLICQQYVKLNYSNVKEEYHFLPLTLELICPFVNYLTVVAQENFIDMIYTQEDRLYVENEHLEDQEAGKSSPLIAISVWKNSINVKIG